MTVMPLRIQVRHGTGRESGEIDRSGSLQVTTRDFFAVRNAEIRIITPSFSNGRTGTSRGSATYCEVINTLEYVADFTNFPISDGPSPGAAKICADTAHRLHFDGCRERTSQRCHPDPGLATPDLRLRNGIQ